MDLVKGNGLNRALRPKSVAVIGAGREPDGIGRAIFDNLLHSGFQGPVYPVNPNAVSIGSVRAYPSVLEVPGPVDLGVIAVPADRVMQVVKDCVVMDVGALVVISAGFGEIGDAGTELQNELAALVRSYGTRMIGPNCLGVINTDPTVRLNATFAPQDILAGRVGLLSQSGAVGIAAIAAATEAGLGISTFVAVGNKADVSGNDVLEFWKNDSQTSIVMLYLESFGNPRGFSEIARRLGRTKPIIAVKSGRSAAGLRAAVSHSGAMATDDAAVDALFHQSGVIRVDTVDDMIDVALVLDRQELPAGNRVLILGNSGGPGIMAADACEAAGLTLAELSGVTQQRLRTVLPHSSVTDNPVDLLAGARASDYEAALNAVLADDGVDSVVVVFTRTRVGANRAFIDAISAASAMHPTKTVVGSVIGVNGGIVSPSFPCFRTVERAVRALGRVTRYATWRSQPEGQILQFDVDVAKAREVAERARGWLTPEDASALLSAYGIPVVARAVVDRDNAVADLVSDSSRRLTVRSTATGGVETVIGVVHDDRFGPLVMFGLGGIATELLADRAFRSVPMTDAEAASLVREIRGHPMLDGYGGAPSADVHALEGVLLRVAQLAYDVPELEQMDLNPVIATPDGVVIVDAKIRLGEPAKKS